MYTSALLWNGISNRVYVNVSQGEALLRSDDAFNVNVYRILEEERDENLRGLFIARGSTSVDDHWSLGEIQMNDGAWRGDPGMHSQRLENRQAVFIHEVGHALKLNHPNEVTPGWSPVSIMLGEVSLPHTVIGSSLMPIRPQGYDKFNLIMKWGR